MAGRVEVLVERSVQAFVVHDGEVAKETIELDHQINQDEVDIDALCFHIFSRRNPMSSDLRFLTLSIKMVTDLERIGDLAVNISERTIELSGTAPLAPYNDIPRMANLVQQMVNRAIDAVVHWNADEAKMVLELDNEVDELYAKVFRHLLELMRQNPEVLEQGIRVQAVAKYLERMGDHATNLAEQAVYLIHGKDIRHEGNRSYSPTKVKRSFI